MLYQSSVGAIALAVMLWSPTADAQIFDYGKYPDFTGQWIRWGPSGPDLKGPLVRRGPTGFNGARFDPAKPNGVGQEAPLTLEYQAIFEAGQKEQSEGGQGNTPTFTCLSPGMPRATNGYGEIEFVVTPDTTYILVQHILDDRRIFTDGRDWTKELEPTFLGYSIGKWVDTDGDGRYDTLEVETRGLRGPRAYDATGLPLHRDNQSVFKERIYRDKADPNIMVNEITTIDNALTRPWSAVKRYRRVDVKQPVWPEAVCAEGNVHVDIGGKNYFLSGDGLLMPARKDQAPPDLKYFKQPSK